MNSDIAERAAVLRKTALRQEGEAASLYGLALDCGRWGLFEAEAEARRHSRALRIGALLNHAEAAALEQQRAAMPRLAS